MREPPDLHFRPDEGRPEEDRGEDPRVDDGPTGGSAPGGGLGPDFPPRPPEAPDAPEPVGGPPAPGAEGPPMSLIGLAYVVVALLLAASTPLGHVDAFLLGALLVLLPSLAVLQLRMLGVEPLERVPVYLGSGATILLLGGASLLAGASRIGWEGMGLGAMPPAAFALWTLGLTFTGTAVIAVFHWMGRRFRIDESAMLEQLLPETPREKALFAALSLVAGVGEELAYRAYAITTIALALSAMGLASGSPPTTEAASQGAILWISIVISSVAFGFLHAYQGTIGVLRTALLGFVLAVSFLMTGNLWPAIAAHTLIDLLAGLVFGRHMLRDRNGHGN